jgi:hypothetical protein
VISGSVQGTLAFFSLTKPLTYPRHSKTKQKGENTERKEEGISKTDIK